MYNPFVNDRILLFRCFFVVRACARERKREILSKEKINQLNLHLYNFFHVQNNRLARNERLAVSVANCWTTARCSSIAIEITVN